MRDNFYTYCLLKYKHSPFLDESINIGVLIYFNESQKFSFKYSKNLSRVNRIYNNVPEKTIKEYLRQIDNRFKKYESFDEILFPLNDSNLQEFLSYNILPRDASVLQFTNFKTNEQEYDNNFIEQVIFEQYFIEDIKAPNNTQQEPIIISNLYKELRKQGFDELVNKSRVQRDYTLKTNTGNFNFDFAWKNGVWNLVKPVGFDVKNSDYIIQKARNNLGEFTDLVSEVNSQYKCAIIVGKPSNSSLFDSYKKALSILEKVPKTVKIIEENNIKTYTQEILEAVSKPDSGM